MRREEINTRIVSGITLMLVINWITMTGRDEFCWQVWVVEQVDESIIRGNG